MVQVPFQDVSGGFRLFQYFLRSFLNSERACDVVFASFVRSSYVRRPALCFDV